MAADWKGRRVAEEIVKRACRAALQKAVTTKTHSDLIAAEVVPNIEGGPRQPSYPMLSGSAGPQKSSSNCGQRRIIFVTPQIPRQSH